MQRGHLPHGRGRAPEPKDPTNTKEPAPLRHLPARGATTPSAPRTPRPSPRAVGRPAPAPRSRPGSRLSARGKPVTTEARPRAFRGDRGPRRGLPDPAPPTRTHVTVPGAPGPAVAAASGPRTPRRPRPALDAAPGAAAATGLSAQGPPGAAARAPHPPATPPTRDLGRARAAQAWGRGGAAPLGATGTAGGRSGGAPATASRKRRAPAPQLRSGGRRDVSEGEPSRRPGGLERPGESAGRGAGGAPRLRVWPPLTPLVGARVRNAGCMHARRPRSPRPEGASSMGARGCSPARGLVPGLGRRRAC